MTDTATEPPVTHPVAPTAEKPRGRRFRLPRLRLPTRASKDRRTAVSPAVAPTVPSTPVASLDTIDWKRWYPALMTFVAGVVVITFAMSYHGLHGFAYLIAHQPWILAMVAPLGIDVFSLCCLAATFLLRAAPLRVRLYSWLMFFATVVISVAGNAVYAIWDMEQRTTAHEWGLTQISAVVGTAIWPVFAAGALHLLIIGRRHLEKQRDRVRQAAIEAARVAEVEQLQEASAISLAAAGATVSDILASLELGDEKRRTVERWTKTVRDALAAPRTAVAATSTTRRAVNARTDRNGA